MTCRPQNPDAVFPTPAPFAVVLAKLAFVPCDDDPHRAATLFGVADQFPEIASVIDALSLLSTTMRGSSGAPLGSRYDKQEISVVRVSLLADSDSSPRPRLFGEV